MVLGEPKTAYDKGRKHSHGKIACCRAMPQNSTRRRCSALTDYYLTLFSLCTPAGFWATLRFSKDLTLIGLLTSFVWDKLKKKLTGTLKKEIFHHLSLILLVLLLRQSVSSVSKHTHIRIVKWLKLTICQTPQRMPNQPSNHNQAQQACQALDLEVARMGLMK